jgi:hypothetical protein
MREPDTAPTMHRGIGIQLAEQQSSRELPVINRPVDLGATTDDEMRRRNFLKARYGYTIPFCNDAKSNA